MRTDPRTLDHVAQLCLLLLLVVRTLQLLLFPLCLLLGFPFLSSPGLALGLGFLCRRRNRRWGGRDFLLFLLLLLVVVVILFRPVAALAIRVSLVFRIVGRLCSTGSLEVEPLDKRSQVFEQPGLRGKSCQFPV